MLLVDRRLGRRCGAFAMAAHLLANSTSHPGASLLGMTPWRRSASAGGRRRAALSSAAALPRQGAAALYEIKTDQRFAAPGDGLAAAAS